MPMTGVKCPSCAASGRESWVIPGRICQAVVCGKRCNGSHTSREMNLTALSPWNYCGDLVFASGRECGGSRLEIDSTLFGETWTMSESKRFTSQNFNRNTEFMHTPLSTKLL